MYKRRYRFSRCLILNEECSEYLHHCNGMKHINNTYLITRKVIYIEHVILQSKNANKTEDLEFRVP